MAAVILTESWVQPTTPVEDLGILKTLPNIRLYFPGTHADVSKAVLQIEQKKEPTYLRLGISGFATEQTPLTQNPETLTTHYHAGNSVTIIGIGHAVQIALSALKSHREQLKGL